MEACTENLVISKDGGQGYFMVYAKDRDNIHHGWDEKWTVNSVSDADMKRVYEVLKEYFK